MVADRPSPSAQAFLDELRLFYAERRDSIPRLKNLDEQAKRSRRLPIMQDIGAFFSDNLSELDLMIKAWSAFR